MPSKQYLDFGWYYSPLFQESFIKESQSSSYSGQWQAVQLPHTNIELPASYFDDRDFAFISAYRRKICLPFKQSGKQLALLRFEGVMSNTEIYLNGEQIAHHKGGYTPFEVLLPSSLARWGQSNQLLLKVDSTECPETPPFGFVIDYLTYGGIYRDVSLHINEALRFGTVKITPIIDEPQNICNKNSLVDGKLNLELEIPNPFGLIGTQQLEISGIGFGADFSQSYSIELQGQETENFCLESPQLHKLRLWDIEQGNLYQVQLKLGNDTEDIDEYSAKIGWRDCYFTREGFWINGRYEKLRGLNRHQSYPFAGYAMPVNAQKKDADLFLEYGCNILRTSHYPQHRQFIEYCDEIGLPVFTEIPGWQHIGESPEWQEQVLCNLYDMILRDYNSPSIVLWGVRINESQDHHELYSKTNQLARQLDPSRQTAGVRCHKHSELLEDVYTMNNFVLNGSFENGSSKGLIALNAQHEITGLDHSIPYLVTESNGHMFPTKAWDPEERRTEHAVRHLRVLDSAYRLAQHSGSISWCAFDYNTHHEFGAGDKICHHGVFDMYRKPKFAAWAYRSQKTPKAEIVMQPLSCWARGERDESLMGPLWVLHNCDYIELYMNGKQQQGKIFPARSLFPALPHPPSIIPQIEGLWGTAFNGAEFKGFIDGKAVISRKFLGNPVAKQLYLQADQLQLSAKRPEATRLALQVADQLGNSLPFFMGTVRLQVRGAKMKAYADHSEAMPDSGQELFATLRGGSAAIWLLSCNEAGRVDIAANVLGYAQLKTKLSLQIQL